MAKSDNSRQQVTVCYLLTIHTQLLLVLHVHSLLIISSLLLPVYGKNCFSSLPRPFLWPWKVCACHCQCGFLHRYNQLQNVFHLQSRQSSQRFFRARQKLSLLRTTPSVVGRWQEFRAYKTKEKCCPAEHMIQFSLRTFFVYLFNDAVSAEKLR